MKEFRCDPILRIESQIQFSCGNSKNCHIPLFSFFRSFIFSFEKGVLQFICNTPFFCFPEHRSACILDRLTSLLDRSARTAHPQRGLELSLRASSIHLPHNTDARPFRPLNSIMSNFWGSLQRSFGVFEQLITR